MSFSQPCSLLPPPAVQSSKNMHFNLSAVTVVLATMGLAQASVLLPRNPLYEILNSRQAAPGCETDCGALSTGLTSCTTTACICTADIQAALQKCLSCSVKAYYDACAGSNLPPITLASASAAKATSTT